MALLTWSLAMAADSPTARGGSVEVLRLPEGGVQADAAVDAEGVLHRVYLGGDAARAEVWYQRRAPGQPEFDRPVRVNQEPGRAVAVGTVRGPRLAVGLRGERWVIWNGSGTRPGTPAGAALWLATAGPDGRFGPEQELNRETEHLDGGASVAAGGPGEVWAVWHSGLPGSGGETNRGVFSRRSADGGKTFGALRRLDAQGEGACGCCGLRALGRADGTLAVLYRTASEGGAFRDMALLLGRGDSGDFRRITLDRWSTSTCPMSTADLAWLGDELLAAWETRGEARLARIHPALGVPERIEVPGIAGVGGRKHPSLAAGPRGGFLLAWVEATGWAKGGWAAWQRFDVRGNATGNPGRGDGVPVWGTAEAWMTREASGVIH